MSAGDLDPPTLKRYTPSQIININQEFECWEKPLSVVRVWRRIIRSSANSRQLPEKRPALERVLEIPWRRELGGYYRHMKKLENALKSPSQEIRLCLNKLCSSSQDKISPKLLEIAISSKENMNSLIMQLLTKAGKDVLFIDAYADSIDWLMQEYFKFHFGSDCSPKNISRNPFRRTLLNNFQDLFENAPDQLAYPELLACLFLKNIISYKLLFVCVEELLTPVLSCASTRNQLKVKGAVLILKKAAPRVFAVRYAKQIEPILRKLELVQTVVTKRLKLLAMDVFDLHSSFMHKALPSADDS